ncbi:MAG: DUF1702 family protein [Bacteroidetes bacterium]|nr:DUF1702 family protein [Bacteroidota bacterium]
MKEILITQKMDTIQNTFLRVQDIFFESPEWRNHVAELESTDIEFRSIAYESASMSIALEDLKQGEQLTNWFQFLNEVASAHATQVHVGLGWAFAQQLKNPIAYLTKLNPMMRYRVLDGYGYYEGIFRRRRSIINHLKLQVDDAVASAALDQGLGRSIWYLNKGIIDDAKIMIEGFAIERHKDLWRGLGIAIAYVGGCDEEMLKDFFSKSDFYKTQLATGAVMALVSRDSAKYISTDTELACKVFCNKTAEQILELNYSIKSKIDLNHANAYCNWVTALENTIAR